MPADKVVRLRLLAQGPISLDAPIDNEQDDDSITLGDIIQDSRSIEPATAVIRAEQTAYLRSALARLPAAERTVIEWRYGFVDGEVRSVGWIARELRRSRKDVERTVDAALAKLRLFCCSANDGLQMAV